MLLLFLLSAMVSAGVPAVAVQMEYLSCFHRVPGRICDPYGLLSPRSARSIQKAIDGVFAANHPYSCTSCVDPSVEAQGFEIGVVIANLKEVRLPGSGKMAADFHASWGLGGLCKTGVMLFVAPDLQKVVIVTGKGAGDFLNESDRENAMHWAKQLLKANKIDKAVHRLVQDIGLALAGTPVRQPSSWSRASWTDLLVIAAFVSLVILAIGLCAINEAHRVRQKQHRP